jgi:hypothetical protein
MNNVLPRGTYVEFDSDDYLGENYVADAIPQQAPAQNTQEEMAS